jgi:hypothetical protein
MAYHFEIPIWNVLNQSFNELPHRHSHEMLLALMILVPECDRFPVVSVQSCFCGRWMPDVSGYISCYSSFVCNSGFFREMYDKALAIFLEKLVYEHREYHSLRKCRFELGKNLISPRFSHSVERDDFLVYEPAMSVESSFGHEYVNMRIKAQTLGKEVQHNDSAGSQSSVSVLVGNCVVDSCNCSIHQNLL